ncbi:YihY/virulence factor BrkB family protein [Tunicatimonas pelagia]|uniref:YihY/virulence factor BrkB family protein n=1 Tax=Tunicatimonas pelagia TaxID=931531 RepID=UPI00266702BE|nr:YihY/virulence factor BrkB family protein [Tunicatimonas pelagia]WKN42176.1 YihY/virulence factor BrkB family protein [Tunicatimonas pelagia]
MTFPIFFNYMKETYQEWSDDDAFQKSASLAYYSIFSIPALMIIVINIASLIWTQDYVQQQLTDQVAGMMGTEAANQVETMISKSRENSNSTLAIIIGIATLIFGATGVFYQLQKALNDAWEVEPNPDSGIKQMAKSRINALGIVVAIGFLLMVSLLVTTALSALSGWIQQQLPGFPQFIFYLLQIMVSIGVITVLFAAMFKVLPDAKVEWRSVWAGALLTAILFTIGKFLIGFYIGKTDPASTFGAAGSIVLIMLWVYYTGLILLFGAEFTQVYARNEGHQLEPDEHAQRTAEYRLQEREKQEA